MEQKICFFLEILKNENIVFKKSYDKLVFLFYFREYDDHKIQSKTNDQWLDYFQKRLFYSSINYDHWRDER